MLFRLALESAPAGTSWHAVADEGDAVRDIAAVIGRRLGLPAESRPEAEFGPFGPIFAMDQPASAAHTARPSAGPRRTRACSRTWMRCRAREHFPVSEPQKVLTRPQAT